MATPQEKLAESLEALHELQGRRIVAIRSRDLSRTHRERLLASGFLKEVIKGWYIPSRPDEAPGDSTAWYASFWGFCASYLTERFGEAWCLSPEQSLARHGGNRTVPAQLLVRTPRGGNKPTALPHGTSLFDVRNAMPPDDEIVVRDGLRLFSVPAALVAVSGQHFRRAPTDVRAAMATVKDASDVLAVLLAGGHSTIAGRLAGAFRNAGNARIADEILRTMEAAGYAVRETDPFGDRPAVALAAREASPYVNRLRLMWEAMRGPVLETFPASPGLPGNPQAYLKAVEDVYVNDAYHSLSIEGYRVSPELIERMRSGAWDPDGNPQDLENRNALAARGNSGHHQRRRSRRLSERAGLYPPLDACAAATRGGARLRAGAVRAPVRRSRAGRARRARALHLRLCPSLHGRQRPHREIPHERDVGLRRLSVDDRPCGAAG